MRVFYGYNRTEADGRRRNCERSFIDTPKTKRQERGDMIHHLLREGDTIVVVSERDLGRGVELRNLKAFLEKQGVTLVTDAGEAPTPKAQSRGLSEDQKAVARRYWHLPGYSIDYINDRLADEGLEPATRNQLRYALGERGLG